MTLLERFHSKYIPVTESGCWIWIACCNPKGYGQLNVGKKMAQAHRYSYQQFIGAIPAKLQVCHSCDVTSCVNPTHLFLGTNSDNQKDSARKKRHHCARQTHCCRGHELTESNIYYVGSKRRCKACRKIHDATQYYKERDMACNQSKSTN